MDSNFDPGALLARSYELPRGPRVRLRLPGPGDAPAIGDLYVRCGLEAGELELARLLRFDPRTRVVIAATALVDSRETTVGIGSIALKADAPDTVVVDGQLTDGLDELLRRALIGRARAITAARAA